MIAVGEWIFGFDSFGWRIASVVVGALTVLVLCGWCSADRLRAIRCLAGFLLAIDGVHLVLSRLALLDVFVTFWTMCAVACLVADRDWIADRLTVRRSGDARGSGRRASVSGWPAAASGTVSMRWQPSVLRSWSGNSSSGGRGG